MENTNQLVNEYNYEKLSSKQIDLLFNLKKDNLEEEYNYSKKHIILNNFIITFI